MTFEERWHSSYDGSSGGTSGGKLAQRDMCGVVIQMRQPRASRMQVMGRAWVWNQVIGMPQCTCVRKRITGHDLIEAVREQIRALIGSKADDPWKLFKTTEKAEITHCKSEVEDNDFE